MEGREFEVIPEVVKVGYRTLLWREISARDCNLYGLNPHPEQSNGYLRIEFESAGKACFTKHRRQWLERIDPHPKERIAQATPETLEIRPRQSDLSPSFAEKGCLRAEDRVTHDHCAIALADEGDHWINGLGRMLSICIHHQGMSEAVIHGVEHTVADGLAFPGILGQMKNGEAINLFLEGLYGFSATVCASIDHKEKRKLGRPEDVGHRLPQERGPRVERGDEDCESILAHAGF